MTEEKTEEAVTTAEPETKKPKKSAPKKKTALDKVLQEKVQKMSPAPVQMWALANIVLPEVWNRQKLEKKAYGFLMTSIEAKGQIAPLLVRKTSDAAKVELVDGRRRYQALKELGIKQASISFTNPENDVDARLTALIANAAREDNSDYDLAVNYKALIDAGMSGAAVGAAVGRDGPYVNQRTIIFEHDPRLVQMLQKGTIPLAVFRYLAPLRLKNSDTPDEDKKAYNKLVDKIVLGKVAPQEVQTLVDEYKGAKQVADAKAGKAPAKKKKPGPKIEKFDFLSQDIRKQVKPLNTDKALKLAQEYADLAELNHNKVKREFQKGVVLGLELALGLAEK